MPAQTALDKEFKKNEKPLSSAGVFSLPSVRQKAVLPITFCSSMTLGKAFAVANTLVLVGKHAPGLHWPPNQHAVRTYRRQQSKDDHHKTLTISHSFIQMHRHGPWFACLQRMHLSTERTNQPLAFFGQHARACHLVGY